MRRKITLLALWLESALLAVSGKSAAAPATAPGAAPYRTMDAETVLRLSVIAQEAGVPGGATLDKVLARQPKPETVAITDAAFGPVQLAFPQALLAGQTTAAALVGTAGGASLDDLWNNAGRVATTQPAAGALGAAIPDRGPGSYAALWKNIPPPPALQPGPLTWVYPDWRDRSPWVDVGGALYYSPPVVYPYGDMTVKQYNVPALGGKLPLFYVNVPPLPPPPLILNTSNGGIIILPQKKR